MYATQHTDTNKNSIKLSCSKPRNKHLHEVLSGRSGGRMQSPKDQNRQRDKRELRRMVNEDSN